MATTKLQDFINTHSVKEVLCVDEYLEKREMSEKDKDLFMWGLTKRNPIYIEAIDISTDVYYYYDSGNNVIYFVYFFID